MGVVMPGRDRLDLVTLLVRIAATKSLSEAARATGMSQPSASRLLKQLETEVGATLVRRSPTKDSTLTRAGERFLGSVRSLVSDWDQAVASVHAERDRLEGPLRVVAPVAAGQDLLAKIAARFIRANSGVTFEWRLSDAAVDPTCGGYDLWIRAGNMPTDDLVVREIWRIERAIVAASSRPLIDHPSELLSDQAVRLTTFTPEAVQLTRRDGETFQLYQSSVFKTDNLFAARAAVLEGVGYALLPLWAVQEWLERRMLVRLCQEWSPPIVTLALAYAPTQSRPLRLTEFLTFTKSELTRAGGLGVEFSNENQAHTSIRLVSR